MKIIGVIPARWDSKRFPGKPLAKIGNKTMIQMVYEQAKKSKLIDYLMVATDDQRIWEHAKTFGPAKLTGEFRNGTERVHNAVAGREASIVVVIQGDEPMIDPEIIDLCIKEAITGTDCVTPVCMGKKSVNVAFDIQYMALMFSRSRLPGQQYGHIGLYVYRRWLLDKYVELKIMPMEDYESLEQLRLLENGYKIRCVLVDYNGISVDTPEDLNRVRDMRKKESNPPPPEGIEKPLPPPKPPKA